MDPTNPLANFWNLLTAAGSGQPDLVLNALGNPSTPTQVLQTGSQVISDGSQAAISATSDAISSATNPLASLLPTNTTVAEYAVGTAVLLVLVLLVLGKVEAL